MPDTTPTPQPPISPDPARATSGKLTPLEDITPSPTPAMSGHSFFNASSSGSLPVPKIGYSAIRVLERRRAQDAKRGGNKPELTTLPEIKYDLKSIQDLMTSRGVRSDEQLWAGLHPAIAPSHKQTLSEWIAHVNNHMPRFYTDNQGKGALYEDYTSGIALGATRFEMTHVNSHGVVPNEGITISEGDRKINNKLSQAGFWHGPHQDATEIGHHRLSFFPNFDTAASRLAKYMPEQLDWGFAGTNDRLRQNYGISGSGRSLRSMLTDPSLLIDADKQISAHLKNIVLGTHTASGIATEIMAQKQPRFFTHSLLPDIFHKGEAFSHYNPELKPLVGHLMQYVEQHKDSIVPRMSPLGRSMYDYLLQNGTGDLFDPGRSNHNLASGMKEIANQVSSHIQRSDKIPDNIDAAVREVAKGDMEKFLTPWQQLHSLSKTGDSFAHVEETQSDYFQHPNVYSITQKDMERAVAEKTQRTKAIHDHEAATLALRDALWMDPPTGPAQGPIYEIPRADFGLVSRRFPLQDYTSSLSFDPSIRRTPVRLNVPFWSDDVMRLTPDRPYYNRSESIHANQFGEEPVGSFLPAGLEGLEGKAFQDRIGDMYLRGGIDLSVAYPGLERFFQRLGQAVEAEEEKSVSPKNIDEVMSSIRNWTSHLPKTSDSDTPKFVPDYTSDEKPMDVQHLDRQASITGMDRLGVIRGPKVMVDDLGNYPYYQMRYPWPGLEQSGHSHSVMRFATPPFGPLAYFDRVTPRDVNFANRRGLISDYSNPIFAMPNTHQRFHEIAAPAADTTSLDPEDDWWFQSGLAEQAANETGEYQPFDNQKYAVTENRSFSNMTHNRDVNWTRSIADDMTKFGLEARRRKDAQDESGVSSVYDQARQYMLKLFRPFVENGMSDKPHEQKFIGDSGKRINPADRAQMEDVSNSPNAKIARQAWVERMADAVIGMFMHHPESFEQSAWKLNDPDFDLKHKKAELIGNMMDRSDPVITVPVKNRDSIAPQVAGDPVPADNYYQFDPQVTRDLPFLAAHKPILRSLERPLKDWQTATRFMLRHAIATAALSGNQWVTFNPLGLKNGTPHYEVAPDSFWAKMAKNNDSEVESLARSFGAKLVRVPWHVGTTTYALQITPSMRKHFNRHGIHAFDTGYPDHLDRVTKSASMIRRIIILPFRRKAQ